VRVPVKGWITHIRKGFGGEKPRYILAKMADELPMETTPDRRVIKSSAKPRGKGMNPDVPASTFTEKRTSRRVIGTVQGPPKKG